VNPGAVHARTTERRTDLHPTEFVHVHSRHRSFLATLASVAILAACDGNSPTTTPPHVGTWVLQSAAGQPAPALIETTTDPESGKPIDVLVTSDTLELHVDGTYHQRARLEVRLGGQLVGRPIWSDHGLVTVTGTALHFDSNYLQNVTFDGGLASGAVTLTQNLAGEGQADVYVLTRAH
jgi:hypothetical protein